MNSSPPPTAHFLCPDVHLSNHPYKLIEPSINRRFENVKNDLSVVEREEAGVGIESSRVESTRSRDQSRRLLSRGLTNSPGFGGTRVSSAHPSSRVNQMKGRSGQRWQGFERKGCGSRWRELAQKEDRGDRGALMEIERREESGWCAYYGHVHAWLFARDRRRANTCFHLMR